MRKRGKGVANCNAAEEARMPTLVPRKQRPLRSVEWVHQTAGKRRSEQVIGSWCASPASRGEYLASPWHKQNSGQTLITELATVISPTGSRESGNFRNVVILPRPAVGNDSPVLRFPLVSPFTGVPQCPVPIPN